MAQPPARTVKLADGNSLRTSYNFDFGTPLDRSMTVTTRGFSRGATTTELFEGTTKATHHIPGYSGHIPLSTTSTQVRDVTSGATTRPPRSTNLYDTFHLNIPGYMGYVPRSVFNHPHTRSPDLNTTTGSMVSLHNPGSK
ncbi:hypothetical protein PAPYR_8049 [Paratrimastix pyriformis]|uniref:Uncharacterized protein n=1 Tax=Paratrimastix pyriformis TaxID=342808 RepID=A0ABQ8UBJ9_9EUKA|nr:hypothetical protein PAPYR_8049 [Paratrimastix pyriformis]